MPTISLRPETLIHFGAIEITNSLFSVILLYLFLIGFIVLLSLGIKSTGAGKIRMTAEIIFESLGKMFTEITGQDYKFSGLYSFVLSFFIIILISNWFGLLPFVGPVGLVHHADTTENAAEPHGANFTHKAPETLTFLSCIKNRDCALTNNGKIEAVEEMTPLFRAPSSDLSFTLALALISVITVNILGMRKFGTKYLTKYFSFKNPIDFVVGILEFISEIGKILSFSFRLFGNIFAGEVLLIVITFISFGIITLPFYGLEFFVGMIQALVFFMLTSVFISLAVHSHD